MKWVLIHETRKQRPDLSVDEILRVNRKFVSILFKCVKNFVTIFKIYCFSKFEFLIHQFSNFY